MQRSFPSIIQKQTDSRLNRLPETERSVLLLLLMQKAFLALVTGGTNGVDISVGKLMVYTAAAGIDPQTVLPVVLDCGSNRESLLKDPFYLGNRHKRIYGDHYYDFVNRFVKRLKIYFPICICILKTLDGLMLQPS